MSPFSFVTPFFVFGQNQGMEHALDFLKNFQRIPKAIVVALWLLFPVFYLLEFRHWEQGKFHAWTVFYVLSGCMLAWCIDWLLVKFAEKVKISEFNVAMEKRFKGLSLAEKEILRGYVEGQGIELTFHSKDPAVRQLIRKRILFITTGRPEIDGFGNTFQLIGIYDAEWEYLKEHRGLLE